QRRQTIYLTVGPAVFDGNVLALDIAGILETLPKSAQAFRISLRRLAVEKPDHRQRRLLGARRERPNRGCAAEQRDELAALCMSGKQHSERRRGFGHDRLPVATGSPQALRISNHE